MAIVASEKESALCAVENGNEAIFRDEWERKRPRDVFEMRLRRLNFDVGL